MSHITGPVFHLLVQNTSGNAVKYTSPGGGSQDLGAGETVNLSIRGRYGFIFPDNHVAVVDYGDDLLTINTTRKLRRDADLRFMAELADGPPVTARFDTEVKGSM